MKLSIITINLNNQAGLERTMYSVVNQKYHDYEFIIIDGGSTDNSINIIKKYSVRCSYWISEADNGIYNAMNKGIKASKGDYCLFLNSGDYLFNDNTLSDLFSINFSEDIVYGSILYDHDNKQQELGYPEPGKLTFSYFRTHSLPHPCTFIRRELFDLIGMYDEQLKIVSDWKFFVLAVLKFNVSLRKIPQVVSVYNYKETSSISSNKSLIKIECDNVLKEYFPYFLNDYKRLDTLEMELAKLKESFLLRLFLKIRILIM